MGMADWGGGVDYSGLFKGLADQFQNEVDRAIAEGKARTEEEQAADDAEKYDQWKNGLISDGEWLMYLHKRVRQTEGDPKEHQYWVQTLREHETSIEDARLETAYSLGRISIHKLIAHYQGRMKDVKKNSPAYREAASRFSQLVQYRDQTGGGSGGSSGGGSGGGRSGGSYWPKGFKPADTGSGAAAGGKGKGKGGNDQYPVDPINQISGFHGYQDYMQGLFGDLDRIDAINDQLDANPSAKSVTDPLTGETFAVTPDFLHAMDSQYLHTQDLIASAKWADGDKDGATQALKYRGSYIASTMQKHNSELVKPVWDEQVNTFLAGITAASAIEDPEERARAYAQLAAPVKKTADRIQYASVSEKRVTRQAAPDVGSTEKTARITRDLPDQLRVDTDMQLDIDSMLKFVDIFGDPNMSVEQRAALASDLIDNRPEGFPLTESQIQEYLDGNSQTGLIGGMETHVTRQGLLDGTHVFFHDGNAMRVMTPEEVTQASNANAGDTKGEHINVVATWQRVNGRTVRVFEQIHPTESDFFAYAWTSAADTDKQKLAGTYVPSSQIDSMSKGQFDAALRGGLIEQVPVQPGWRSAVMPDGKTWYQDPETNLWYQDIMPIVNQFDRTGGVMVGDDGKVDFKFTSYASAGGVFQPFSGMSPQEAQRLVEGDVAAGLLDPSNYGSRDETGDAQYGAPDVAGMYWDPRDHIQEDTANFVQGAKGFAANQRLQGFALRQQQRAQEETRNFERSILEEAKAARLAGGLRPHPADAATAELNSFGEKLGLRMGGTSDPKQPAMQPPDFDAKLAIDARRQRDIQRLKAPQPIRARLPQAPARRELPTVNKQAALPRVPTRQAAPLVEPQAPAPQDSTPRRRRAKTPNLARRQAKIDQYTSRGVF